MNYLYTQYKHYTKYINENGTDRVYKGLKIQSTSSKFSSLSNFKFNEEIFEKPVECEYKTNYINKNQIKITFKSKNDIEYRLDIFKIVENGVLYNHISYTKNDDIFDKSPENQQEQDEMDMKYEEPTIIFRKYLYILFFFKNRVPPTQNEFSIILSFTIEFKINLILPSKS